MNAVFAADREPDERKPRPHSEAAPLDELKRILTAKPQPFRIQFVGAAPGHGLTILSEVEIQASGVSAATVAAATWHCHPKRSPCASLTVKAKRVFERHKTDRLWAAVGGSNVLPINGAAPVHHLYEAC